MTGSHLFCNLVSWTYLHDNGHLWQCYDSISPICDPWQRRFPCALFYAHPIIPFYTINYISLLCYPFSPFLTTSSDFWVGWISDITTSSKPHFQEPNPPEGVQKPLRDEVFEVHSKMTDLDCNALLCLQFLPQIILWTWNSEINHNTDRNIENRVFVCMQYFSDEAVLLTQPLQDPGFSGND